MKKIIRILSVSALLATAAAAQAQVYVEGAYAPLTFKDSDFGLKAKPAALSGVVGYNLHPNLDVEGFLGLGVKKSEFTLNGAATGVKADISSSIGAFLKPKTMLTDEIEVFARVGYAHSKLKLTGAGMSDSGSEGSFAYGLGGNYYMNKQTYLTASYMSLFNKDNVKATGFNFGVGYKF
jgi:outer membrane autotransporter protein